MVSPTLLLLDRVVPAKHLGECKGVPNEHAKDLVSAVHVPALVQATLTRTQNATVHPDQHPPVTQFGRGMGTPGKRAGGGGWRVEGCTRDNACYRYGGVLPAKGASREGDTTTYQLILTVVALALLRQATIFAVGLLSSCVVSHSAGVTILPKYCEGFRSTHAHIRATRKAHSGTCRQNILRA